MLTRRIRELAVALVLFTFLPTLAWSQFEAVDPAPAPIPTTTEMTTRDFLSINGATSSPSARVTLYRNSDDELCAVLGVRRGPKALNSGFFKFKRLLTVDGESREKDLTYSFPKKHAKGDKKLWIWQACLTAGEEVPGSDKDLVRITVRRPGHTPTKMWVKYPPVDAAFGLNISTASNSELIWTPFAEDHPDAG